MPRATPKPARESLLPLGPPLGPLAERPRVSEMDADLRNTVTNRSSEMPSSVTILTISPQMIFILGKKFSEVISQLAEQLQMFSDLRTLPSSQRTGNRAPHASTFHICKELLCQQASFGRSLPLSI